MNTLNDLRVTQNTALQPEHRIRDRERPPCAGPLTVDDICIDGRERNRHDRMRRHAGRRAVGKSAVAGVEDRDTNRVSAAVVDGTDGETLRSLVQDPAEPDALVYADDATANAGWPHHEVVCRSVPEYVDGRASTNGLESFRDMLQRGYQGRFHPVPRERRGRHVNEFAGRRNNRPLDTIDRMAAIVPGFDGNRLSCADPIA